MTSVTPAGSLSAATVRLLIFMGGGPLLGKPGEASRRDFVAPRGSDGKQT